MSATHNPSNDAYNDVTLRMSRLLPVPLAVENLWDNATRTIARQDYGPEWYWDDFRQAIPMLLDMLSCVPYPVNVIINMAADSQVDWRGAELHGKWLGTQWPVNYAGQMVIVATPHYSGHIHQLFRAIQPRPLLVSTLEGARTVLQGRTEAAAD